MSFDNSESDYSTSDSDISELSEIDEEELSENENIEDLENISDEEDSITEEIGEEIIEEDDEIGRASCRERV